MAAGSLPTEVLWVSVLILVYSAACWLLNVLLVYMLWKSGERYSYITLMAVFGTISTLASIIQQCHYAAAWVEIKEAEYQKALATMNEPASEFGGVAQIWDVVLCWIQKYCYNVEALLILFWAMALFSFTWNLKLRRLSAWSSQISMGSKIFAVLFPPVTIGLTQLNVIAEDQCAFFFLVNMNLASSFTIGSVLLVLILYKYVKSRRRATGYRRRSRWWNTISPTARSQSPETSAQLAQTSLWEQQPVSGPSNSIYDHALIIRFTIGFFVLSAYEVATIGYEIFSITTARYVSVQPGPDLSTHAIITELLFFLPGVTISLLIFLFFGTTKSLRRYRAFLDPLCCCSRFVGRRSASPATWPRELVHAGPDGAAGQQVDASWGSGIGNGGFLHQQDVEQGAGAGWEEAGRGAEPLRSVSRAMRVVSMDSVLQEVGKETLKVEERGGEGRERQRGWETKSVAKIQWMDAIDAD